MTSLLAPFALPGVLLLGLRVFPGVDLAFRSPVFHLVVGSTIAALAFLVAVAAAVAGSRAGEHGPVWLAFGCLCVGILLFMHGLLTPGVLVPGLNQWVGRSPYLAITLFAVGLAMAGRARNVRTSRLAARRPEIVLATPTAVLGFLLAGTLAVPTALAATTLWPHEQMVRWVLTAVDCVIFAATAVVHWRRWRLGHDPIQYALMLSSTLSIAALASLAVGRLWRLSWWDYHVFLLAGFGGAVYAVVVRYHRTRAVDSVLAATFASDPMIHIVNGYPDALKALVGDVERKDSYTHGHSQRTAEVAVQIGLRVGVDDDVLRAVARGGYLHDVGKIGIPDAILNKPGRLTPEERSVIETHPQFGFELVSPVTALEEAVPAVLHHHERWDGAGYPRGLGGTGIPLIARIVCVADVWDALTSDRSYRPGWSPGAALAHMQAGSGTHFDPDIVAALIGLAADWGYSPAAEGDAGTATRAAETCHEATSSRA